MCAGGEKKEMAKEPSLEEAVAAVTAEFDADLFFYSGPINDLGFGKLAEEISKIKSAPKALLVRNYSPGLDPTDRL
jgi:hypothetical protein